MFDQTLQPSHATPVRLWHTLRSCLLYLGMTASLAFNGFSVTTLPAQEIGVSASLIRLGGVMDLAGDSSGLGQNMKAGLEAAFADQQIQGRRIEFNARNDFYNPQTTVTATEQLIAEGVFAMIGNVGTPTAQAALPLLAKSRVPAVGFFTGAGLLRPGEGDIINFRASYVQEVSAVVNAALSAGLRPSEICAYVQNDAYGMAGVAGIKAALTEHADADAADVLAAMNAIMTLTGNNPERNYVGPVGVYKRNTLLARDGYDSLKAWELVSGVSCRLVVSVGAYSPIARFVGYARFKGETWPVSAVSFTGADNFQRALKENGVSDGVIMTQVTPALDSSLAIVEQARAALGKRLNYVSLEGFIVGKLFLTIANNIDSELTRQNFLSAARGRRYDVGGLTLDFSSDNQASDQVLITVLKNAVFSVADEQDLTRLFQ